MNSMSHGPFPPSRIEAIRTLVAENRAAFTNEFMLAVLAELEQRQKLLDAAFEEIVKAEIAGWDEMGRSHECPSREEIMARIVEAARGEDPSLTVNLGRKQ